MKELHDFDDNWNLTKYVSSIVDEDKGRKILIHILDIWDFVNESAKPIWLDLVERAGFYPYYVEKIKEQSESDQSLQSKIRMSYFKSDFLEGVYFHEQQKEIERLITNHQNVAISAPTSFGKSLLIEEVVARKEYKNILIIQPTLALIDETRKKMMKYSDYYNLIINTHQKIKEKNIFILTAERVLEIDNLPRIDFFIIDEFYKISNRRHDSRIDSLNIVLLRVMEMNPQAMFLTPSVNSLSENFRKKYNVHFFNTDYALVNTQIEEVRTKNQTIYSSTEKKRKLFTLLKAQNDSSIVYVKSPNEAYKLASEYLERLENKTIKNPDLNIFEWMDENISNQWQLKELLKYGIGVHNGVLPRHVVTSEIELFNEKKIDILFATVSLIEGVNTVAKNMFIFSSNKGKSPIDFFDFANIRGRAGRMGQYFTGKVFLFNEEPVQEKFVIDVPFIDQDDVSDEILINIPDENIKDKSRIEKLKNDLDDGILNIIQSNLISVSGQKKLYNFIEDNFLKLDYLQWQSIPTYDELRQTLNLGYEYLENKNNKKFAEKKAVLAIKLIKETTKQVILDQENYYIRKNKKEPLDYSINEVLKFQREDAKFKIPKLLSVIESIQKYVFEKHGISNYGEYTTFASLLENDGVSKRLQFLVDYGVPSSAIRKIDKIIPIEIESDFDVILFIKNNKSEVDNKLIKYERELLNKAIF